MFFLLLLKYLYKCLVSRLSSSIVSHDAWSSDIFREISASKDMTGCLVFSVEDVVCQAFKVISFLSLNDVSEIIQGGRLRRS